MQLGHPVSEDCLTINIWTKPQSGEKAKAVLLWIYGGGELKHAKRHTSMLSRTKGFATGNSANTIYDGQFLADNEDVVVVSFK
jgi:cholinesterase